MHDPMIDQTTDVRVVVVDDHPMAREWTRASFQESEGLTVIGVAEDGANGLHLIADKQPDVVVLDVHLPDISGVEVARRVRTALPEIGIVVVTGFDDPTYAQALLQLGVRGYLTKSASAEEIVYAVREAASGRTVISSDAAKSSVSDAQPALGPKERQLLALLASGRRNNEIATALDVSLTVVEYRVGQLLQLLGARSRAEAIQMGYELGIAPPPTAFVGGMPAAPALKVYHGHRSASSGRYTVQVQEGQEFRLLQHECKSRQVLGCQSVTGWDHGFSAFGGVELARWLLADCLGDEYLSRTALHYSFKSAFLNRLPPSDWIISEGEIRKWADDHGLLGSAAAPAVSDHRDLMRPTLSNV
jgi:DNA-binding NarL/FixJ family response regulator